MHNRQTSETGGYTSFSKQKKEASKPHKVDSKEIQSIPKGSIIHTTLGFHFEKQDGTIFTDVDTGEVYDFGDGVVMDSFLENCSDDATVSIPDSANPNYNVTKVKGAKEYEAAFSKAYDAPSKEDFDSKYREQSGKIYQELEQNEKKELVGYTGTAYGGINESLRAGDTRLSYRNKSIDAITAAIDKSELQSDTILYRGCSSSAMEKLFGLDYDSLTPENASSVIGKSGTDDGFTSTGSTNGSGFQDKEVRLQILAPAGTKALYVEPFSALGHGQGLNWDSTFRRDGKSAQSSFSTEMETILQRGTKFTVISGGYEGHQFHYKVAVTGQDYENSEYNKNRKS